MDQGGYTKKKTSLFLLLIPISIPPIYRVIILAFFMWTSSVSSFLSPSLHTEKGSRLLAASLSNSLHNNHNNNVVKSNNFEKDTSSISSISSISSTRTKKILPESESDNKISKTMKINNTNNKNKNSHDHEGKILNLHEYLKFIQKKNSKSQDHEKNSSNSTRGDINTVQQEGKGEEKGNDNDRITDLREYLRALQRKNNPNYNTETKVESEMDRIFISQEESSSSVSPSSFNTGTTTGGTTTTSSTSATSFASTSIFREEESTSTNNDNMKNNLSSAYDAYNKQFNNLPPLSITHPIQSGRSTKNDNQKDGQKLLNQYSHSYNAMFIVPTGVGAAIGGYAGDALPTARLISEVVDHLITHPNVMNGASLYWPKSNIHYTEGYALDEFASGDWGLIPLADNQAGHRIGLILDKAMSKEAQLRHLQVANGARATLGLTVSDYIVTDEPMGVEISMSPAGASWGDVKNPLTILRAAKRLVNEAGCTAIAIVGKFPDDEDEDMLAAYRQGEGVDCVGGAEAIISHFITSELKVPCAHAPSLPPLEVDESVSPRSCAEELGYTFLSCVLMNLHRAPILVPSQENEEEDKEVTMITNDPKNNKTILQSQYNNAMWAEHIDAVIAPVSACGGNAVLSLCGQKQQHPTSKKGMKKSRHWGPLLIAVEENSTEMKSTPMELQLNNYVVVKSYLEAVGVLVAHKNGINVAAATRTLPAINQLR